MKILAILYIFVVAAVNEGIQRYHWFSKSENLKVEVSTIYCNSKKILIHKRDTVHLYFPLKVKGQDSVENNVALDTFTNIWYSKMLWALHEPILTDYNDSGEVYRFTWLRTFHHPVVARIEKKGPRITLILVVSDGAGGYEPGNIITNKIIAIDPDAWHKLQMDIVKLDFWNLPVQIDFRGNDGAEWILEGTMKSKYHFTTRWSPSTGSVYRSLCQYLVSLGKLQVPKTEQY